MCSSDLSGGALYGVGPWVSYNLRWACQLLSPVGAVHNWAVLLSDRDIRSEIGAGRVRLDPYDPQMVQPASIDVRLDRWFRLFDNHRYPVIDPAVEQSELTHLVDVGPDEPFILHPGEFVLGSTYERITLPDDIAARLEGKSSLGRLGLLTHSTAGFIAVDRKSVV